MRIESSGQLPIVVGSGFGNAFDLEFGPDGWLYVADFANERVLRIAPEPPVPLDTFLCYEAKPAKGQPKHVRHTGVHVNHQLDPAQLDTLKEEELCLPSNLNLSK